MPEGRPKSTHHAFKGTKAKFVRAASPALQDHLHNTRRAPMLFGSSSAPHGNGSKETERRRRQIEAGQLKVQNGLTDAFE